MSLLKPIILAGGSGSRLWPASRQLNPKQFLPLLGEISLLQQTVRRLDGLEEATACPVATPCLICAEDHRFLAAEQLRQCGLDQVPILLEPVGRNTAPALALAALHTLQEGEEDPLLLVLAADHQIADVGAFHAAIKAAVGLAEDGFLVTFGIVPNHPETGYGYIQRGPRLGETGGWRVERFVEKPCLETAQAYLHDGGYLWNSGMFLFRASRLLEELERYAPAVLTASRAALSSGNGAHRDALYPFIRLNAPAFAASPAVSIDYAVMEHTARAAVVPLDAGWSDVGSWSALWDASDQDASGNVLKGDVLVEDVHNSLIDAGPMLVAGLGVDNLVVVVTHDAVLVARQDKAQDVRKIVERLKAEGRTEHLTHRKVYRPWGCYDSIDVGPRHQVKRITVNPGARLSRQLHHHRAEHWIVVQGTARVTNGDRTYLVTENQSTFIPIAQIHCLENPGAIPLELIEVQSGSYLGEDDIVRLDDIYGRDTETSKTETNNQSISSIS